MKADVIRFFPEEAVNYDRITWCQQCHLPIDNERYFSSNQELAIVSQNGKYGIIHREYISLADDEHALYTETILCPSDYDTIYQLYTGGDEGCFVAYMAGKCCLLRVFYEQFQGQDYVYCKQVTPCSYGHIACEDRATGLLVLFADKDEQYYSLQASSIIV